MYRNLLFSNCVLVFTAILEPRAHAVTIVQTESRSGSDHIYHLLSPSTWTDAEAFAVTLHGHLVTINDAAEEDWLWTTFNPDGTSLIWIGMHDVVHRGTFVWTSGEPVTYTNWQTGEPTSGIYDTPFLGPESYAQMGYGSIPYPRFWNDLWNIPTWAGSPMQGVVEIPSEAVPEPSTLVIACMGIVTLVTVAKRQFRATAAKRAKWSGLLLSLSLLLPSSVVRRGDCAPVEWPVLDGGNGHFYEFVAESLFWDAAFSAAIARPSPLGYTAHLLTISNSPENAFVANTFPGMTGWMGFTDRDVEGEWRWIDNTPGVWQDPAVFPSPIQTAFAAWAGGEPNNWYTESYNRTGEDFGIFNWGTGMWNDGVGPDVGSTFNYFVEFEPMSSIPEPSTFLLGIIGVLALATWTKAPGPLSSGAPSSIMRRIYGVKTVMPGRSRKSTSLYV